MQTRDLSDCREYVPGKGADEVARARGIDPADLIALASNENALGPSPAAVDAVQGAIADMHRYPKGVHTALVEQLADVWNVSADQIWLANGGDGALDYLSRAMLDPGDVVLVPDPGFAYYGMSARYHHGQVETYPLTRNTEFSIATDDLTSRTQEPRIIYVTSPHNPTGATLTHAEINQIADDTSENSLVVIDEAYGAFAETPSAIDLVQERDDVAVLRSFSKSYGLAGVRLGYAVVPEAWAAAYRKVNTPFAASELACRAGRAALDDETHLTNTVNLVTAGRDRLREELDAHTWPSEGNFVLVSVGDGTAVAERLLDRGILIRDCTSFGLPDCIRITVGTEREMNETIAAVNAIVGDGGT